MRRFEGGFFPPMRYLVLAAILAAAAVPLASVVSSATEPTVSAVCASECSSFYAKYAWSPTEASIGAGGVVVFANTTPGIPHGIVWSSPVKPVCDSSVPVGAEKSSPEEWRGTCTFSQAGTYTFYCSVHGPSMSGTITVSGGGTTTIATTPPPSPSPTTPTPSPSPSGEGSPLKGSPANAVKLAKSQHGSVVRGSLALSAAAAGRRLEIDLLARGLRGGRHSSSARVGRLLRGSLSAGTMAFAVRLDAAARRVLSRKGRLALKVKIAIGAGGNGKALVITRAVEVHA